MKRDWFTCSDCGTMAFHGFQPYCEYNRRYIRWPIKHYGCGHYSASDREAKKMQWRYEHDLLSEKEKEEMRKAINERLAEALEGIR